MRNETLKNLLLTASLISASALLTACGDDAKDPAKSTANDKIKKEEDDVLKTRDEAIQTLTKEQLAAGEEVKSTANQAAMDFANFDAQLPAKVEKASAEAMVKAKMAYLEFEKNILPKTIDALQKELTSIAFPMIDINQDQNITKLKSELDSLNEKLAKTPELSVKDQQAKLKALLVDRKNLKDTYLQEVIAYYSASNYGKEADIAKRDQIITEMTNSFVTSQKDLEVRILQQMLPNLQQASLLYNQNRQTHVDNLNALKQRIDELTSFAGDQTKEGSLTKTLTGYFFDPSPKYYLTAMFKDNWDKYFLTVKDKLMSASMTRAEFADDLLDKFQTFIQIRDGKGRATLAEIAKTRTQTAYQRIYKELKDALVDFFGQDSNSWRFFFNDGFPAAAAAQAAGLSAGTLGDISGNVSFRQARTSATGSADLRAFNVNGAGGESIALGMPLFVQLKGDVSSSKATEAATGSVAYRLGSTVLGAIQGYANSGDGFGIEGRQFETSVVASHSFGSFFIEGQLGTVSATDVHSSNWKGMRSQVTLGLDTEFVSPFVQITHRQLDRSGLDLNQTTGFVGLDMDVAKLKADSYSVDARLTAKVGYGEKAWSVKATDLGSTTGVNASVEWAGSLNLNSGVKFTTNLGLDTVAGSSAAVNVNLDR